MVRLNADEYDDHARHNEQFLDLLMAEVLGGRSVFCDWGFVVVFYTALHFTKGHILRHHNEHADDHVGHYDRETGLYIEGHNDLVERRITNAHLDYLELFDLSIQARYGNLHRDPAATFPELKRKKQTLERIKSALV